MKVNREVRQSLRAGGAVVALESTLITHGLPYPDNWHTASEMEQAVREEAVSYTHLTLPPIHPL